MGQISEMMLEGVLCQGCGEFIGEGDGFPVYCAACQDELDVDQHGMDKPKPAAKVKCPECGKKVKEAGLANHRKDAHGIGMGKVQCKICEKMVKEAGLKQHMDMVHGGG